MSAQDRVQNLIGQLDRELSKYPALSNLEKQTNVPKAYAVIGVAALYFFLIIFNLGGQLLTNIAGFVIPGYYSLNALFTANKQDDTQWLTYWVVFAFFTSRCREPRQRRLLVPLLLHLQVCFPAVAVSAPLPVCPSRSAILSMPLTQDSGAEIIFNSFLAPMLAKYFTSASTASGLRAQANKAE
ncbi:membrane biogenesis protein yop1 [Colletotrichum plurivorum]|uniref:Protein YOP1 n=1 Tax=Colletotrichum plurivorum TaxID=2175906 RepID=A0A8H6KAP3_9PEZI|nr:membrane biogenesis protein yop1 [Colletotrichum plurivorum]